MNRSPITKPESFGVSQREVDELAQRLRQVSGRSVATQPPSERQAHAPNAGATVVGAPRVRIR